MIGDHLNYRQIKKCRELGTIVILSLFGIGILLLNFDSRLHWWSTYPSMIFSLLTVVWLVGLVRYDAQEEDRVMQLRRQGKNMLFTTIPCYPSKMVVIQRMSRYERINESKWVV